MIHLVMASNLIGFGIIQLNPAGQGLQHDEIKLLHMRGPSNSKFLLHLQSDHLSTCMVLADNKPFKL